MNSTITFNDVALFNMAVDVLALDAVEYEVDADNLSIHTNDADTVSIILESEGISMFDVEAGIEESDEYNDSMDGDFDSAMASAGLGTDESYGDYGSDD